MLWIQNSFLYFPHSWLWSVFTFCDLLLYHLWYSKEIPAKESQQVLTSGAVDQDKSKDKDEYEYEDEDEGEEEEGEEEE